MKGKLGCIKRCDYCHCDNRFSIRNQYTNIDEGKVSSSVCRNSLFAQKFCLLVNFYLNVRSSSVTKRISFLDIVD